MAGDSMPGMAPSSQAPGPPPGDHAMAHGGHANAVVMGSYKGHALAGAVFLAWGLYVSYCVIVTYLNSSSRRRNAHTHPAAAAAANGRRSPHSSAAAAPFSGRPWYPLAAGPGRVGEPAFKLVMGLVAVCVELRFTAACHVPEWMRWAPCWPLYTEDGQFEPMHMNNWQHALMYFTLALSGAVDLISLATDTPPGTEQAGITFGFLCSTLLMGLHGKHVPLDQSVHSLLTLSMAGATACTAAEGLWPRSFPLAAARPMLLLLVGSWFIQIGRILFLGIPAWSVDSHPAGHMVPAVYVAHIVVIGASFLALYLVLSALHARGLLRHRLLTPVPLRAAPPAHCGGHAAGGGGWEVEMGPLMAANRAAGGAGAAGGLADPAGKFVIAGEDDEEDDGCCVGGRHRPISRNGGLGSFLAPAAPRDQRAARKGGYSRVGAGEDV